MGQVQISFHKIDEILKLNGTAQLNRVTLDIHQHLQSHCTCVVEVAHLQHSAHTISFASNGKITDNLSYHLSGTTCEKVAKDIGEHIFYQDQVYKRFPEDQMFQEDGIQAYIGLPLKTQNGEVLGILLSTFTRSIHAKEAQDILDFHRFYANVIIHSLREKWVSERSDKLLNQLSYEVSHDNLTGLLNRSCLADTLETLTQQATRPFSLAYLDIDNFKSINDINGNYIGDQIIKFTANAIQQSLSSPNNAFRVAGDEFAFITYDEDPVAVCQEVLDKIESGYSDKSNRISFTVSIGIARAPVHMLNSDELILNASLALKDCKKHRDTRIQHYDTHLSALYHRRTQLIEAMRIQLSTDIQDSDELYVVVQPIVDITSDRWNYFEILTRWNSNIYGNISPAEFIEAAEQSGLIIELGERIIELACIAKQELEANLGYKVKLSINCSAYELVDSNRYINHLTNMVEKYQHEAKDFVIELTETVLLSQSGREQMVLNSLRYLGFKVALDDFGTGYSSLNYIHNYPIDSIKIDATFVQNMLSNTTSEQVVFLIAQLAELLDVDLIAEGVEDDRALQKLIEMGCHYIQGYFYSRPHSVEEIVHLINEREVRSA
ncbi:TPA: putative bifunctional diguanylate cyclase/phosphodiesterase [Vibrio alginolyticus]|uniref:putative bifunctional diguanylate cyclase/phosphodiesterase n=1 Tax=Vibrio TaxID=662 RepID=UPI00063D9E70|nr:MULTISPECIES: GGDEF domain-containing phosphodiesterase [Vibrio]KLI73375.1 diguanylate cyclase [Vibrio alginolyticus]MDM4737390.1 EAL domain-containing protein [Vibrio alginolyticus]MDM4757737.1 EAL domain-containing protein [Vibrio alginolyticus]MDW2100584.1 EAL domain-containing protein [Vibrio sp. 1580]HCZ9303173.1 EAL domain-containing protein [Vibrio alginolyticus]